MKKNNGYWNQKRCFNAAKKCKTKREFQIKFPGAYKSSLKNGWHYKNCEHMKTTSRQESIGELSTKLFLENALNTKFEKTKPNWLVNPETNHLLELDGYSKDLRVAFEYGDHKNELKNLMGKKAHNHRIRKDEIKKKICQKQKVKLIQIPIDIMRLKNSEQVLKDIIKNEFKRLNIKAVNNIDLTPFKIVTPSNLKYNNKKVWEIARMCKNRDQFERGFKGAFRAAERLGIISQIMNYFRNKSPKKIWTIELAKEAALKCKKRNEFCNKYPGAYKFCINKGILDEICTHMSSCQLPWGYWNNKEKIIEVMKKCKTRSEFNKKYSAAASQIQKNNWIYLLNKYLPYSKHAVRSSLKAKSVIKLTFQECKEKAKTCETKKEFSNKFPTHYYKSIIKRWLPLICSHMLTRSEIMERDGKVLTDEKIIKAGSVFKNKVDFRKKSPFLYRRASERKILGLIFKNKENI